MDFSRLAYEHLHTDLATVAKIFLVLALMTPFVSLGYTTRRAGCAAGRRAEAADSSLS